MGCDIHSWAERKTGTGFAPVSDVVFSEGAAPFDWRSYGMFGFLADVRNYSAVPSIAPRRGFPLDASEEVKNDFEHWESDAHSASWISVSELAAFDYDAPLEDRRIMRNGNGGCTCEPGEGEMTTFRDFLGPSFFRDVAILQRAGADRVVFWFDN